MVDESLDEIPLCFVGGWKILHSTRYAVEFKKSRHHFHSLHLKILIGRTYEDLITLIHDCLPLRLRVNLRPLLHKLLRLFFHPLLQRLFLSDALFGGVFADVSHAGFSTTLPSCQTITGSFIARCWVLTLCAARRRARSARITKAGALVDLRACPLVFIGQSIVEQIQYHV